jgi:hypothetical protein
MNESYFCLTQAAEAKTASQSVLTKSELWRKIAEKWLKMQQAVRT